MKDPIAMVSNSRELNMQIPKTRGEETPRKLPRAVSPFEGPFRASSKSIMPDGIESTSNVATPLVRPMRDAVAHETRQATHTSLVEDDVLELPEAAHSTSPKAIPLPSSNHSSDRTASSVEGYDFYGMESFSPVMDFVAPSRKAPLRLDYSDHSEATVRMQPQRHDSGESFQMFSTSGDSQPRFMSSSESDSHSKNHGSSLRDRVSSWEHNLPLHPNHRASIDSDALQSETSDDQSILNRKEVNRGVHSGMPNDPAFPPIFHIQEASVSSRHDTQPVRTPVEEVAMTHSPLEEPSDDPNIIESDFLPQLNDPDFVIPPIDPKVLVHRAINFEAQTGALNAAAMVLLLRPFLPPASIDETQAEAILAQYHQRLNSMKLFTEAALLRNICVPLYPNVFAMAQQDIKVGYFCTDCHKPLENDPLIPDSQWRCPRCRQAIDCCAVCRQREIDPFEYDEEDTVDSTIWWYCPGCGHGGHTACMAAWHAGPEFAEGTKHSGGSCPLEGCLHPCLPGIWREMRWEEKKAAKQKEMDMLVKENSRQGSGRGRGAPVRRDVREVNQSKAVEGVRVALGVGYGGLERKSVKVVAPGEEGVK